MTKQPSDDPNQHSRGEFAQHLRGDSAEAGGTWPVKAELAEMLRRILDQLPRSGADEATLQTLLEPLRTAAESLERAGATRRSTDAPVAGMSDFPRVSPIVGFANPIAPPFDFRIDEEARIARGSGMFRRVHEGAPGIVHGGLLAAAVDELLGMASVFCGQPGMTGELTIRYLKPTPIEVPLEMEARLDEQAGRRLTLSAEVRANGEQTARATAVFVAVGAGMFSKLDDSRRLRNEE